MDSPEYKEKLNKAFGLHQQGNLSEAEVMYNELLKEDPNNANVLNLLGMLFYKKKQYINAAECLQKAVSIAPDAYFYFNLGNIYSDMGEIDKAISEYKKGLAIEKDNIKIICSLANNYKKKNDLAMAIVCYESAIKLSPTSTELYMNVASLYFAMKKPDKAAEVIEDALKVNPQDIEVLLNLAVYYRDEDIFDKAIETNERVLQVKPDSYKAYINLSTVYYDMHEYDKSVEYSNKALSIKPDYAEAYINLANVYKIRRETQKAIEYYDQALSIKPDHAEAHFNLSTTYLLNEVYDKGWQHYECRFYRKAIEYPRLPKFPQPIWDGSPIEGKTIYVSYEQGLGDILQFARFLPVLASRGAKVLFKCPHSTERLLKQSNLNAEIININYPDTMLEFDTYAYLMSLPLLLGADNFNIPYSEGYLKAENNLVNEYKEKYFENDCFKVGICWNSSNRGVRKKGTPLELFYKLADIDNVKLYSLQKGLGVEKLQDLPDGVEIIDLGKTFDDFADTAAAVENLDLVISVDTSVVHLAGAMGKPVWNLLPFAACWRWLLDREDSPWYKSMRIIRQKSFGDWKEVLDRVHSMLVGKLQT